MTKVIQISDDEKWRAVVNCDKNYDDIFLYGVTTTEIFCRPSCKSKIPVRTNVVFFKNATIAIEAGFRPCKRCCPDKIVMPDLELVKEATEFFNNNFSKEINLNHFSKQLGISSNHFARLFKGQYGITPTQYITKLRVDKAIELLGQQDLNILEIAHLTGFISLSNFYKCFKEQIGLTPKELRERI
ncbi:Ada metal-binding domain-containing protein [Desulfosporosinus sp. FKB]|uniref:bifunctional transcriptional activator/DNA repair enzyme AdaA n=1 Tax=Desulfosporosinus sp. FKB TaxID=1969835 RepID=UPI000B49F344|nr:Ada metal-binding domain-containing protein [Desulfosporosinus sp. FKB]